MEEQYMLGQCEAWICQSMRLSTRKIRLTATRQPHVGEYGHVSGLVHICKTEKTRYDTHLLKCSPRGRRKIQKLVKKHYYLEMSMRQSSKREWHLPGETEVLAEKDLFRQLLCSWRAWQTKKTRGKDGRHAGLYCLQSGKLEV